MPIARPGDFSHNIITAHQREPEFIITNLPVTYKMKFSPEGGIAVTGGKAVMVVPPHVADLQSSTAGTDGDSSRDFIPLRSKGTDDLFGTPARASLVSITGVASVKRESVVELGEVGKFGAHGPVNVISMTHAG